MKKYIIWCFAIASVVLVAGCSSLRQKDNAVTATAVQKPVKGAPYICEQAVDKVVIDGKLTEKTWKNAAVIDKFYVYKPENPKHISATKARLAWDKDNLYIAIECEDDDIWSYSDKADDQLWRGDVSEFFVKPSTSALAYCEFVMAPNGTLYDGRYPSRGSGTYWRFKDWSSHAKVKSTINGSDNNWKDNDTGYVIEVAIPFSAFSEIAKKPVIGDTWTFGVCRYDYTKSYENPLLLMTMPESPYSGYHYYEGYGALIFR